MELAAFKQRRHASFKLVVIIVTCMSLLIGGCAGRLGVQTFEPQFYQNCYDPVKSLRSSNKTVLRQTVVGAVTGALVGAALGALAGGGRNLAAGLAIGGVAGLVTGATMSYAIAKQSQKRDFVERMKSYEADIDEDMQRGDMAAAAAKTAQACYEEKFRALLEEVKAKSIDKAQAELRFNEIQSGLQEMNMILQQTQENLEKNQKTYGDALAYESHSLGYEADGLTEDQPNLNFSVKKGTGKSQPKPLSAQQAESMQSMHTKKLASKALTQKLKDESQDLERKKDSWRKELDLAFAGQTGMMQERPANGHGLLSLLFRQPHAPAS